MRCFQPGSRVRHRIWASGLFLAAAAVAAIAGPAAVAAPLSATPTPAAASATAQQGAGAPVVVTWSVFPATSSGPDPNRNEFNYGVVQAGSSISDHVEIVNRSKSSAAFSIYATDATGTTQNGALTLLPAGKKPTDIGSWANFPGGAGQLSAVIPGSKAIIEPFTVNVPRQATPGDHTGVLIAAVGVPKLNSAGVMVVENYRIAVPIEIRVPGALHAGLQVSSISTGFSDSVNPFGNGSADVSYTVTNTGNVRQSGAQLVTVTGPFGQSSFVHPVKLPTILPGDSIRVSTSVPGLFPDGPMTANVAVTPGWPANTIKLSATAAVATGSASLFAIPWSLIGLILLLIAAGVGVRFYFRYRGRMRRAELAAVAARARQDTERRLLGKRTAANGHQAANGYPAANGQQPKKGQEPAAVPSSTAETADPASATAATETTNGEAQGSDGSSQGSPTE